MLRQFLKKYLPAKTQLQQHRYLKLFGKFIDNTNLWHFNDTSIARAIACGLFAGFMPIPFQMILSAALAIALQANITISVTLVWFSNPITMPPIFYFAYKVGTWILATPSHNIEFTLSWHWFHTQFLHIWKSLLIGSLVCGITSAIIGYIVVKLIYRSCNLKKTL